MKTKTRKFGRYSKAQKRTQNILFIIKTFFVLGIVGIIFGAVFLNFSRYYL